MKKSQYIMNNAINEITNTLEGSNSRTAEAEDSISDVEDRMVVLNSLSFYLSVKFLISPSYLNEILAGNGEGNGTPL